jgi:hypothetical protein
VEGFDSAGGHEVTVQDDEVVERGVYPHFCEGRRYEEYRELWTLLPSGTLPRGTCASARHNFAQLLNTKDNLKQCLSSFYHSKSPFQAYPFRPCYSSNCPLVQQQLSLFFCTLVATASLLAESPLSTTSLLPRILSELSPLGR